MLSLRVGKLQNVKVGQGQRSQCQTDGQCGQVVSYGLGAFAYAMVSWWCVVLAAHDQALAS